MCHLVYPDSGLEIGIYKSRSCKDEEVDCFHQFYDRMLLVLNHCISMEESNKILGFRDEKFPPLNTAPPSEHRKTVAFYLVLSSQLVLFLYIVSHRRFHDLLARSVRRELSILHN